MRSGSFLFEHHNQNRNAVKNNEVCGVKDVEHVFHLCASALSVVETEERQGQKREPLQGLRGNCQQSAIKRSYITSSIIIHENPIAKNTVPTFDPSFDAMLGISSFKTANIIAPAANPSKEGRKGNINETAITVTIAPIGSIIPDKDPNKKAFPLFIPLL